MLCRQIYQIYRRQGLLYYLFPAAYHLITRVLVGKDIVDAIEANSSLR